MGSKLKSAVGILQEVADSPHDCPERSKARRALAAYYGSGGAKTTKPASRKRTASSAQRPAALQPTAEAQQHFGELRAIIREQDEQDELALRMGLAEPEKPPRMQRVGNMKIFTPGGRR